MTCHPRTVEEVMTTSVVSCDRLTPYKEITRLLAEHRISGLPVLVQGWQVVGIVSETDLLAAQDQAARRQAHVGPPRLTAGELMTAPAVTIPPHSTVAAAVRLMTKHHVRRLPVTGADRQLIGVVSQRDVLSVFLRPDTDISHDVQRALGEIPLTEATAITVAVRHGVVTLAGPVEPGPRPTRESEDLIPLAIRLTWDVDGVVDVVLTRH
jgi:CBS domain-containing protein